ncbi:MAG: carbohydrate ABC transporter permease, partial [Burkholderiales bacterium]|nr:carbohydrate ABC transporter permease [Anaerolineae bacterium]
MLTRFFKAPNPFDPSPGTKMFSYLILGFWSFVVIFPFYWLLVTAFKLPVDVSSGPKYIPFVDYQPSLHAFQELLWESGNLVTRPYTNTVIVGLNSAICAVVLGAMAAYALIRFDYRPKPGLVVTFIGCVALSIGLIALGVAWQIAVLVAIAVFLLLAQTIGKRFKGTMGNNDIFFWLVSQRMLPPVAVIIPIYILFQRFGLLNTHAALI